MNPVWICSRCGVTHAALDLAEFDPGRMSCADCLTDAEVDADLRRMGIDPEEAERRFGEFLDRLLEKP